MIAQELEVSLHMAFVEARQKRHEFITVEHLLLALLDNPTAAEVLRACGANMDELRKNLLQHIGEQTPRIPAEREADKWAFLPPGAGAESYDLLSARIAPWLSALDRDTVCVTHGGVIRSIFMLTGAADRPKAAAMDVPQDRVLRIRDGRLDWL